MKLVELAREQEKFDKLERICATLEELEEDGAGHLFWDITPDIQKQQHIDHARGQIGRYHESIVEVESRKEKILADIDEQNVQLDYLHYDLQDIIEQEEMRDHEWVIERDENELPPRIQVMPWARGYEEDRRFHRSLGSSLAASLAIILLIGSIAIPIRTLEQEIELPERVAKLVRQERRLPPPPPPEPEPEEVVEQDSLSRSPKPELVEEIPDDPVPVTTDGSPGGRAAAGRARAGQVEGYSRFPRQFREPAERTPDGKQLGSQARLNDAGSDATGRPERMMVTTSAPGIERRHQPRRLQPRLRWRWW